METCSHFLSATPKENMFVPSATTPLNLSKHTIVIPALTYANVPQLSVDVLLETLDFDRIGYFDDPAILPFAGGIGSDGAPCLAIEVFKHKSMPFMMMQQRSPYIKGQGHLYINRLMNWLKEVGIERIILLCSANEKRREDHAFPVRGFVNLVTEESAKREIETVRVVRFCHEGENAQDGIEMATDVKKMLENK